MDEISANVDEKLDNIIQDNIQNLLKDNCTTITIAHKLSTIIYSDLILVFDQGQLIEYDTPYNLINKKEGGYFNELIDQSGQNNLKQLIIDKYNKDQNK